MEGATSEKEGWHKLWNSNKVMVGSEKGEQMW